MAIITTIKSRAIPVYLCSSVKVAHRPLSVKHQPLDRNSSVLPRVVEGWF